jgi:hypothetical protein
LLKGLKDEEIKKDLSETLGANEREGIEMADLSVEK